MIKNEISFKEKPNLGSSPYKSKLRPGIGLTSQSKELIIRFYEYLKKKIEEKVPNISKFDVISELKITTGLGKSTLFGILSSDIS
jgi:hypothetical protein